MAFFPQFYIYLSTCFVYGILSANITVKIGVILPRDDKYMFSIRKCVPAIASGIQKAYDRGYLDPNVVNFTIKSADSECNGVGAPLAAFNYKTQNTADLFLGPCCDYSLAPVARYSTIWNMPVITSGGHANDFAEKYTGVAEYGLLTRVGTNFNSLRRSVLKLFELYKWGRARVIYDSHGQDSVTGSFCYLAAVSVVDALKEAKVESDAYKIYPNKLNKADGLESASWILKKKVGTEFGVIIMCASPDSIRRIMLEAHKLKFTKGEYVFFNIDLFGSKAQLQSPWYNAKRSAEENDEAKEAYKAMLTITLKKPDDEQYRNFSNEVKAKARELDGFEYGEDEVNSFVGAFHDAVLLYALALNETIEANGTIDNGTEITRRMWNRTFSGITGTVSIDSNGDRNSDYSLLNYDKYHDKFTVAGNYLGSSKQYVKIRNIQWAGGKTSPPLDTPECGFDGSKCVGKDPFPPWLIVTLAFSVILGVLFVIGLFVYRRYRQESELNSMTWRIRSEDLLYNCRRGGAGSMKHGGPLQGRVGGTGPTPEGGREGRRDSRISCISIDTITGLERGSMGKQQQIFTTTAHYQNMTVALKSIPVRTVTVTRAFLLEIKSIKNMQHDHIVRFVGVCLDPEHEYIITEYCPKGSLQDILENEQLELDLVFKHSLTQDIAKGVEYLHSSVIRYHGNLKSTNCVVDSRFVVKITDFGLSSLRTCLHKKSEEESEHQICRRKLWTAPELLDCENEPTVQAYQKADSYSFAIICQEVIYRNGVFYLSDDETSGPEDKIEALTADNTFRPTLDDADCHMPQEAQLVRRCWAVDPLDRPDFQTIKTSYRRFMKQNDAKGGTLVDNLLSRMEQYASNLESLVQERTSDYLEEKKRAEDLLYMMLPKSIASILVRGESVEAEWFDEVTIYFSDIVGFTALSAASTPMQVVAMLNDLYTAFDTVVEEFDVYKVETIGDAYMVVSGLPTKNDHNHAREIARMSLRLLAVCKTFKIRHMPEEQMMLRIGMHTGPVCAGVVGLKMPRYCLFGDTVNTASRMESNGLPLMIHVSPSTKELLDRFGVFKLELRGNVEMKGKGTITTHWLLGEEMVEVEIPISITHIAGVSFRRSPSYEPATNAEEEMLTLPPSNDLHHSAPNIYEQPESFPLVPQVNNNKPKQTKFKENGVDFNGMGAGTPLLNGHYDSNV